MEKLKSFVITLKRTPERLEQFYNLNPTAKNQGIEPIYGIDGQEINAILRPSKLIKLEALQTWSKGAIGAALSHLYCWRHAIKSQKTCLILEDDAILAEGWHKITLEATLEIKDYFDIIFLGWNINTALKAATLEGIETTSLFSPPFPSNEQITALINSNDKRKACKLLHCYGLSSYIISPTGAEKLIQLATPLRTEIVKLGRGLPNIESIHIDALLNNYYGSCRSFVIYPPLVLTKNTPETSLTKPRSEPENFGRVKPANET